MPELFGSRCSRQTLVRGKGVALLRRRCWPSPRTTKQSAWHSVSVSRPGRQHPYGASHSYRILGVAWLVCPANQIRSLRGVWQLSMENQLSTFIMVMRKGSPQFPWTVHQCSGNARLDRSTGDALFLFVDIYT